MFAFLDRWEEKNLEDTALHTKELKGGKSLQGYYAIATAFFVFDHCELLGIH